MTLVCCGDSCNLLHMSYLVLTVTSVVLQINAASIRTVYHEGHTYCVSGSMHGNKLKKDVSVAWLSLVQTVSTTRLYQLAWGPVWNSVVDHQKSWWKNVACHTITLTDQLNYSLVSYSNNQWSFKLKSVKCHPGGRKIDLISSVSEVQSQT